MSYCNVCGARRLKEQHDEECIYHGIHDNLHEDRTIHWDGIEEEGENK